MTRGRQAASSQATLVADEAKHPIGKIQPQPITCNPPNQMQSSLTGAILPMGRIPSEALRRECASPTPRRRRLGPSRDQHVVSFNSNNRSPARVMSCCAVG